jgi:hypothetical protein
MLSLLKLDALSALSISKPVGGGAPPPPSPTHYRAPIVCTANAASFSSVASGYLPLGGQLTLSSILAESEVEMTSDGYFKNFRGSILANATTVPTDGDAKFYVVKNGSRVAGAEFTVPAGLTGDFETSLTTGIPFTNTDKFTYEVERGTDLASISMTSLTMDMLTTDGRVLLMGSSAGSTFPTAQRFMRITGILGGSSTEDPTYAIMPTDGTLQGLKIYLSSNGHTGVKVLYLRVNGADSGVTISVPAGATGWRFTVATVAVNAGDRVDWRVTGGSAGSCVLTTAQAFFVPTVAGESVILTHATAVGLAAATSRNTPFGSMASTFAGTTTPETVYRTILKGSGLIKSMYVRNDVNTATNNTTYNLRANGSNTSVTVTVLDATTAPPPVTLSDTSNTYTYSNGDSMDVQAGRAAGSGSITLGSHSFVLVSNLEVI